MKRWIKSKVLQFVKWFFTKNLDLCNSTIRAFYKLIRRQQFKLKEIKEVNVKRGKARYTLLFVETSEGRTRINLGRYGRSEIDKALV